MRASFRRTAGLSALLLVSFSLIAADCSGPTDAGPGDGDGDGDSGVQAVITDPPSEVIVGQGPYTLDASASVHPSGGFLQFTWSLTGAPSIPGRSCLGVLTSSGSSTAEFDPLCVGTYEVTVVVESIDDSGADTATFTIEAVLGADLVVTLDAPPTWRGVPSTLTANVMGNTGAATTAWSVDVPTAEPGCTAELTGTGDVRELTTSCPGPHVVTVTATDEHSTDEVVRTVDVAESLAVSWAPMPDIVFGETATVELILDPASIPAAYTASDITFDAFPWDLADPPPGPPVAVPVDSNVSDGSVAWEVTPALPHEGIALLGGARIGAVLSTRAPVTALLAVGNNPPEAAFVVDPYPPALGGAGTLTATITDADGDDVTCTFSTGPGVQGGAAPVLTPTDVTAGPSAGDDVCSVDFDLEDGVVDAWQVITQLDDGFDQPVPGVLLCPDDAAPEVALVGGAVAPVPYSCVAGSCSTDAAFLIEVVASDDNQAPEELTVTVEAVSAPDGALADSMALNDVVTVDQTGPTTFEVTLDRAALGPMAGDWMVDVHVNDQSLCQPGGLRATLPVALTVAATPPSVGSIVAPDVDHTYDAASGLYAATVGVSFVATDPEANGLTAVAVELVSCDLGPVGTADCGGANLTVVTDASAADPATGAASMQVSLSSASLGPVAGVLTFNLTATDVDGTVTDHTETVTVLNQPPVLAGNQTLAQTYEGGGLHTVSFPVATDPDGDPLTFANLQLAYVPSVLPIGGSNATASASLDAATGVVTIHAQPANFLGGHALSGTVTDGDLGPQNSALFTIDITDQAPILAAPTPLSFSKHHIYNAGNVNIDPAVGLAAFSTSNVTDPDGDPLTWVVTSDTLAVTTPGFSPTTPQVRNGAFSFDLDVNATFTSFQNAYNGTRARSIVTVKAVDPFGVESPEHSITLDLNNRTTTAGPQPLSGYWDIDYAKYLDLAPARMILDTRTNPAGGFGQGVFPIDFTLTTNAAEPDGDPLTVFYGFTCNNGQTVSNFNTNVGAGTVTVPSGATSASQHLEVEPSSLDRNCEGLGFPPEMEYLLVLVNTTPPFAYGVSCTVTYSSTNDGLNVANGGGSYTFDFVPTGGATYPASCE